MRLALPIAALLVFSLSPAKATNSPYIGEIAMTGDPFCPRNWAEADGQLLDNPNGKYNALYSLIGNTYGGTKAFVQQFSRNLRTDLLPQRSHETGDPAICQHPASRSHLSRQLCRPA